MATTPEHRTIAPVVGPDDERRFTDSGIEVKPLYTEADVPDELDKRLGEPGEYPFTRGIHRDMYRGPAARDHAKRHPQGVHRAREFHLSARGGYPAHHGPLLLLRRACPEVEHDFDFGLSLPREGVLGRAGGGLHARQRDRLCAGRA